MPMDGEGLILLKNINDSLSDPNTSLTIGKDLTVGRNLKTVGIGTIKNLTFSTSSIVSASGDIDFTNNNLTTTGTVSAGIGTFTTVTIGNVNIDVNEIKVLNSQSSDGVSKSRYSCCRHDQIEMLLILTI